MNKSQYIGITENIDPAFHLEIFDKLYKGNIIITKRLTNKLNEKLIEHKDKIILHCTCTGFGGRIDPVIPTAKGVNTAKKVIEKFSDIGIKRVRWSSMDMYDHVKERFKKEGIILPYNTFHAPKEMIELAHLELSHTCEKFGMVLETCGEGLFQAENKRRVYVNKKKSNFIGGNMSDRGAYGDVFRLFRGESGKHRQG